MASLKAVSRITSRRVIYASIAGDFLIGATKFAAAYLTGSSAMLSEGMHSIVDTGNGFLVLYGMRRAARRPDHEHPLGYGREIYFWSFVVAVLLFAVGAGISLYQGAEQVLNPKPVQNVAVNYGVLALSMLFDGTTWVLALRNFKGGKRYSQLFKAIRDSKDPPSFIVLFEDTAALLGLLIAFAGIFLSVRLDLPVLDGVASLLIGLVLAVTAALLARETKSLLIGEPADKAIVDSITQLSVRMPGVANANGMLAVHLAPREVLIALSLEFADELRTPQIEAKVAELEACVRKLHPEVVAIFIKPQTAIGYKETVARRFGQDGTKRQ